jgi:hypothetical protein
MPPDRRTYAALKGTATELASTPFEGTDAPLPERRRRLPPPTQTPWYPLLVRLQLAGAPLLRRLRRRRGG